MLPTAFYLRPTLRWRAQGQALLPDAGPGVPLLPDASHGHACDWLRGTQRDFIDRMYEMKIETKSARFFVKIITHSSNIVNYNMSWKCVWTNYVMETKHWQHVESWTKQYSSQNASRMKLYELTPLDALFQLPTMCFVQSNMSNHKQSPQTQVSDWSAFSAH